jgi:hypothetical protein
VGWIWNPFRCLSALTLALACLGAQGIPGTHVDHIYPSAAVLPANTLRLYIYFSGPMSFGDALDHIHLSDENGMPVPDAFLDQELWNPGHSRLTLLFDPGRIKRGLVPAKEAGTAIVPGHRYSLLIDPNWRDGHGVKLTDNFRKDFDAGPVDRTPPYPSAWLVTPPVALSRGALVVRFPKPMDYALLQKMIEVPGVSGTVTIASDENEWRFTPDSAWKAGSYRLLADPTLEDICGNHLDRAFDVDLRNQAPPRRSKKPLTLRFRIR